MSKDGPNSNIREMGAYPLNITELLIMLGLSSIFIRYKGGDFIKRRKIIQRITMSKFDRKLAEVIKKEERESQFKN